MLPKIIALVSTVSLLAWMLYLLLSCSPLLVLKHDDPYDSRLVRGVYNVHYAVLITIACVGALSSAYLDRRLLAVVIGGIALFGVTARRMIVGRMDGLRATMTATDAPAIKQFRNLHISGLVLDVVLLVVFFAALAVSVNDMATCVQPPADCEGAACRVRCSLL